MAAAPATGMDKAAMKQLLNRSDPDTPLNFAFAQPKDPGPALLILDKMKNPKVCERDLMSAFKDARNPRWGTVTVHPDLGPLVRFEVEKAVTGMAKRLVLTLKGTGFRKVEIVLDGEAIDGAGDEEQEPAAPAPAASAAAEAAQDTPDPAELTQSLTALLRRIGALDADGARKSTMVKVASAANEQIKAGNLAGAAATIARLSQAMEAGAPRPSAPDWAAARAQLDAALAAVDQQVAALQKAISEYGLKDMLASFAPGLRTAVATIGGDDPATLRAAGPGLLKTVQEARATIASDARIAACDDNDLGVAVAIRRTMEPALAAVEAAVATGAKP
jgi:hypothetical protein